MMIKGSWWFVVEIHLTLYQCSQTLMFCSTGCAGNEADLLQHNGCRTEKNKVKCVCVCV